MRRAGEEEEEGAVYTLPPSVLESARINFPSQKGYIEIGRKRDDSGNGMFDFKLRVILVNLQHWLEFTEEEAMSFSFSSYEDVVCSILNQHDSLMDPLISRRTQGNSLIWAPQMDLHVEEIFLNYWKMICSIFSIMRYISHWENECTQKRNIWILFTLWSCGSHWAEGYRYEY